MQAGYFPKENLQFKALVIKEAGREIVLWVSTDYLKIGNAEHSVYVSLNYRQAEAMLQSWGLILPTSKIVDLIYKQADLKLEAKPFVTKPEDTDYALWLKREQLIQGQRQALLYPEDALIAGHMKDLVLSSQLGETGKDAAIYGWPNAKGQNWQKNIGFVSASYQDYSLGIRAISPWCLYQGRWVTIMDLLQNPHTAPLLSEEGTFQNPMPWSFDPLPAPPRGGQAAQTLVQHRGLRH